MTGHDDPNGDADVGAFLEALGGKYSEQLLCAADRPRSVQALSEEIDAPIATCYRRIEDLVDAGLLTCVGRQTSRSGKRTNVYRRTVDEISIDFSGTEPDLTIQQRPEPRAEIGRSSYEATD